MNLKTPSVPSPERTRPLLLPGSPPPRAAGDCRGAAAAALRAPAWSVRQPGGPRPGLPRPPRYGWTCAENSNSRASWSELRPDRTRSTICCRYSAGYRGLDLGIVGTSSSNDEMSTKPGQAQGPQGAHSHQLVQQPPPMARPCPRGTRPRSRCRLWRVPRHLGRRCPRGPTRAQPENLHLDFSAPAAPGTPHYSERSSTTTPSRNLLYLSCRNPSASSLPT